MITVGDTNIYEPEEITLGKNHDGDPVKEIVYEGEQKFVTVDTLTVSTSLGRRLATAEEIAEKEAREAEWAANAIPRAREQKKQELYAEFEQSRANAFVVDPSSGALFFLKDLAQWLDLETRAAAGQVSLPYDVEVYDSSGEIVDFAFDDNAEIVSICSLIRAKQEELNQERITRLRALRDASTEEEIAEV